jgi:hypothetical protein
MYLQQRKAKAEKQPYAKNAALIAIRISTSSPKHKKCPLHPSLYNSEQIRLYINFQQRENGKEKHYKSIVDKKKIG